jgi:hypothetical protein
MIELYEPDHKCIVRLRYICNQCSTKSPLIGIKRTDDKEWTKTDIKEATHAGINKLAPEALGKLGWVHEFDRTICPQCAKQ